MKNAMMLIVRRAGRFSSGRLSRGTSTRGAGLKTPGQAAYPDMAALTAALDAGVPVPLTVLTSSVCWASVRA